MGGVVWLPRIKHSIKAEALNIEKFAKNASSLPIFYSISASINKELLKDSCIYHQIIAIFAKWPKVKKQ